ncbi:hypothetical protein ACTVZO_06970 [Streptomyces sp. IBSNAI002]|uniref:hypothetical protein n=1 Tax=Streptomyces sp. IBSNAI002 TaxID=3457500 RepID=UPI003FD17DFA
MWPGQQQPPGGDQNPQDAQTNPYQQQSGQPNPYQQQPGYGYPQQPGYQQPPTVPGQQWGQPQLPQQPQQPQRPPGGGGSPFQTKTVAIVAASAVIVAAAATGAFVLTRDDGKTNEADDKPSASASADAAPAPAASVPNPRAEGDAKPTVAGWKVVVNPKHGTAFDVPPEWNVLSSGTAIGFEDEAKNDGSAVVMMSAPAYLKEDWCKVDSDKNGSEETTSLAGTGTKGGQGAKDTAEAVRNEAGNWAFAGYAQKAPQGTTKVSEPKEYTTASGLKGHMATASVTGQPKANKCSSDGKSIAFSFKNAKGDFASWILYSAAGVPDEVSKETMEKILSTVRLSGG